MDTQLLPLHRRKIISLAAVSTVLSFLPKASFATLGGRRKEKFILVILRGAMDGLSSVPPWGDPDYALLRGNLALNAPGKTDGILPLDGRFGLHPSLQPIHGWFDQKEMTVIHAMASSYRERSHFDAQNILENGTMRPGGSNSGWLNRALSNLGATEWSALAVGQQIPLVLQGSSPVANWQPDREKSASETLIAGANLMYTTDPAMAHALEEGLASRNQANAAVGEEGSKSAFADLAQSAGKIISAPGGPNICVLEIDGWDTHIAQGAAKGRLANVLNNFALGMAGLKQSLGENWSNTVVVAVTEFGRTARPNGTNGTDHGTASAGFVMGGAVSGNRIVADWPGLSNSALYAGRDLAPTLDMRSLLKGVLGEHLKITDSVLAKQIFPNSDNVRALSGLIKT